MLKNQVIFFIFTLLLGCAQTSQAPSTKSLKKQVGPSRTIGKVSFLVHLIYPEKLDILLGRIRGKQEEQIVISAPFTQGEVLPGEWQLQGVVMNGRIYRFDTPQQNLTYRLEKGKVTYIGSYIIQCPKVSDSHRSALKGMSFFNRYKLHSSGKLCELVRGHDKDQMNRLWKKRGDKQLPLAVGF